MKAKNTLIALLLSGVSVAYGAGLPTYDVVAADGTFRPDVLKIPVGQRFKIVITNRGKDAMEFESLELRKEKVLAPGAQSFVVIAPLSPGTYQFFDDFHRDTGKGRIIVE